MNLKIQLNLQDFLELLFLVDNIISESRTKRTAGSLLASHELESLRKKLKVFSSSAYQWRKPGRKIFIAVKYPALLSIYFSLSGKPVHTDVETPFVMNLLATIKTCYELQD